MKQKLLVIIGPTASKKTTLAHQIALARNGSIINADAFQVYKQINAGVNKPSWQARQEIDYYLLDILDVTQAYDIAQFCTDAKRSIDQIVSQHKLPILAGGSHLYIHALINGYDLQQRSERNDETYQDYTNQQLYDLVAQYDQTSAIKIGLNNRKRLLRYVQFAHEKVDQKQLNHVSEYDTLVIMTNLPRSQLYEAINTRFQDFITNLPWIQEVSDLFNRDPQLATSHGFKAIGYPEIANYVLHNTPIDFSYIQQKTRNLAKMQLTWCKNKFPVKIIFNYYEDDFDQLLAIIDAWYHTPSE